MEERTYLSGTSLAGMSPTRSRVENDYYATPFEATEAILSREEIHGSILEPAAGEGHISKVLREHYPNSQIISTDLVQRDDRFGCGIVGGVDFLTENYPEKFNNVITNPPFSLAKEFAEKALEVSTGKVILFAKIQFLEGRQRKDFFATHPPKAVYVFSKRVNPLRRCVAMKMDKVAGSGNDEFYTPEYAITPLYKYLPPPPVTIWCPFDTEDSLFVKLFRQRGYTVIATHIANGQDFFAIDPPKCDYIISNPPYSLKGEVFERLFQLNIPFAMLVGVVGLFESQKRFEMFREHDFEIMYLNRRVSYFKNYADQKPSLNPPFSSVYVCKGMLPKQIIFEEIQKNA